MYMLKSHSLRKKMFIIRTTSSSAMTALFTLILGISTVLGTFLISGKSEGNLQWLVADTSCSTLYFIMLLELVPFGDLNLQHMPSLETPVLAFLLGKQIHNDIYRWKKRFLSWCNYKKNYAVAFKRISFFHRTWFLLPAIRPRQVSEGTLLEWSVWQLCVFCCMRY